MSRALTTSMRSTRSGVGRCTGPLTRVTRAPASAAAPGRAGGDQHVAAGQAAAGEAVGDPLGQFRRLQHAPRTDVAAGLAAFGRTEQAQAARGEGLCVGLGRRVAPHGLVHRRGQGHRRVGGQHQGGQQIVGHALGEARQQVGGGRGDQHQVGPFGQLDVAHRRLGGRIEQIQMHRMAGQGLEGQGSDELASCTGHHYMDFRALVAQAADQLRALVGGDAAADAQDDAFPIQPLHRPALLCCRDRLPRPPGCLARLPGRAPRHGRAQNAG